MNDENIIFAILMYQRQAIIKTCLHGPNSITTDSNLEDFEKNIFRDHIQQLSTLYDSMGATASRNKAQRVEASLDQRLSVGAFDTAVQGIRETFCDEMREWMVLFLDPSESQMFNLGAESVFGTVVLEAFPSARRDMDEAVKCYALHRSTASVYHFIGVIEAGFKALCKELAVQIDLQGNDCTWNKMHDAVLRQIKPSGHIAPPRKLSHPESWRDEEPFFNEIVTQLSTIKSAYRNPTMHFRYAQNATQEQALIVLTVSAQFMKKLAERVRESS